MERYYFLFLLAFIWTLAAVIQDLKKREVSNWLNYSFLLGAGAYRAFYSALTGDYLFLWHGFLGLIVFYVFSILFYYRGAFGGGDARLLRAYGLIVPFESILGIVLGSLGFILLLFFSGAVYTLLCSILLVKKNSSKFAKEFRKIGKENKLLVAGGVSAGIVLSIVLFVQGFGYINYFALIFLIGMPILYVYLKAVENSCLIIPTKPVNLTEGDWIVEDIKLGNKTIKKTVHGLSLEEIRIIQKANKTIFVKQGIPFVPAFFISLCIMGFFSLVLKLEVSDLFFSLF